ncbi:MAG: carboxypeptidase regulatory-like domain-containing protein [Planctomycetes bacterium]|nr:carboxypeptidase regulatory-like domain-containing protein [Planctomycetota bacterium]
MVLPPTREFRGRVAEADATAVVSARAAATDRTAVIAPQWFVPNARVAIDGSFTLRGVTRGPFVAEARGAAGFALTEREAGAGDPVAWNAALAPGRSVTGRVHTGSGAPIVGLRVALCAAGHRHEAILGDDGTFTCEGLGDLDYELVVHEPADGDGFLLRRVGVRAGEALAVEVPDGDLPGGRVRGRVLDAALQPVAEVQVVAYPRAFPVRTVPCDAEGRFTVDGLPAGTLLLLGGGYPYSIVQPFELAVGAALDLGTVVAPAAARCRVRIDPAMPREGLEVTLLTPGAPSTMVAVARWLGPSLVVTMPAPAGEYVLEVTANGASVHQERVALPPAGQVEVGVPLPTGQRCTLQARFPGGDACTWMQWRLRDGDGERTLVMGPRLPGERRTWQLAVHLRPGRCHVEAIADRGGRGVAEIVVGPDATGPFVVTLQ